MKNVPDLITFIGADRMASALGLTPHSIEKAKTQRRFPASWYDALERLAGRPLDRKMFSFKAMKGGRK